MVDGRNQLRGCRLAGWLVAVATVAFGLLLPGEFRRGLAQESPPDGPPVAVAGVAAEPWNSDFELQVEFELNRPDTPSYRRPYVAVWIEGKGREPVRTLALYLMTKPPGPRWHGELYRWYRDDKKRMAEGDRLAVIDTVSSATRPAGTYKVVWDGRDNHGRRLPQGSYTVLLEAAREHGTYQLIRQRVTCADEPWQIELPANEEVKKAMLRYRRKGERGAVRGAGAPANIP